MKSYLIIAFLFLLHLNVIAQDREAPQDLTQQKRFDFKLGFGYFRPVIGDDGVAFSNAIYDPSIGIGFSYFGALDYALSNEFHIGVGFNGNYARSEFIREAVVNGQTINGYLDAGGVENYFLLVNFTYAPQGGGLKPFAKLGVGYLSQEVELGDVPLELTNNVETEIFTDYKSNGIGVLPEIGLRYNKVFVSIAYSLSLNKLSGEMVDGFVSSGEVSSNGLQINLTYSLFKF